jgi:uncharacterized damage-inducible protein DinB
VIAEVENIPANRFDFRPTPDNRSVTELVLHIMEVSLMMVGELTREETDLTRASFPTLIAQHAKPIRGLTTKRQLLPVLRSTLRDGVKAFRDAGELHMLQYLVRFDGQPGTRLAWFHHGISQEEYHRGQLAIYQRLLGITPALTRLIQSGG